MIKKIRYHFWLLTAISTRHRKIILIGFITGIGLFWAMSLLGPKLVRQVTETPVSIGMIGSYNPTKLPLKIQQYVSVGLTEITQDGKALPALAKAWEVSSDGKEYTFLLRNDVYWHDGEKFTAYHVNYNLKDVQFIPQSETELKVKLKEVFSPLPNFLAKPLFRKGLIGLGKYKIMTINLKEDTVSFIHLASLQPSLSPIEIKFYPTESAAKTAFKLGEVTVLDELTEASPFFEWNTLTVSEIVMDDRFLAIFFNVNDELLKLKEVRQALAFAIDKPEKNRVTTPIARESWAYSNQVKQYEKNMTTAKKLIGSVNKETTITLSTFHQYFSLARSIAANWEALGITTKIKIVDTLPEDFQALLASQEIQSDPDQYPLWHSTQVETNITGYANPKIDKLLEDGRKEMDIEKRKKIYFDFQRYLIDDTPAIFLFHPATYIVTRKYGNEWYILEHFQL